MLALLQEAAVISASHKCYQKNGKIVWKKFIQMFLEKIPSYWTQTKRFSIPAKLLISAQGMKYGLYAWHSQIYRKHTGSYSKGPENQWALLSVGSAGSGGNGYKCWINLGPKSGFPGWCLQRGTSQPALLLNPIVLEVKTLHSPEIWSIWSVQKEEETNGLDTTWAGFHKSSHSSQSLGGTWQKQLKLVVDPTDCIS